LQQEIYAKSNAGQTHDPNYTLHGDLTYFATSVLKVFRDPPPWLEQHDHTATDSAEARHDAEPPVNWHTGRIRA
jgi:hypothetical protein